MVAERRSAPPQSRPSMATNREVRTCPNGQRHETLAPWRARSSLPQCPGRGASSQRTKDLVGIGKDARSPLGSCDLASRATSTKPPLTSIQNLERPPHAHFGRTTCSPHRLSRAGLSHRPRRARRVARHPCDARCLDLVDAAQSRRPGGAPLALDGDELLSSPPDWTASRSTRRVSRRAVGVSASPAAAARVQAHDRDAPRSGGQHQAHGPLSLGLGLLHAMRGGGLSPHHLFPRSARRALDLSRAARGGSG